MHAMGFLAPLAAGLSFKTQKGPDQKIREFPKSW
jgi:hypothetical protein